jgi:hypothetical protein
MKKTTSRRDRNGDGGGAGLKKKTTLQQKRAAQRRNSDGPGDWEKRRAQLRARGDGVQKNHRCKEHWNLWLRKAGCIKTSRVVLTGPRAELAQHLVFTAKDLSQFQIVFDSIDLDETTTIDYDELLVFLEESRSPYTDALFAVVDQDQVCCDVVEGGGAR